MDHPLFQNTLQVDVTTILLLLGEGVIWKLIWSRCRSRRQHWMHWIFAFSPGWAPLAGSIIAALSAALHPPNLIYDRPPQGSIDTGLVLTHLSSGASHSATNTMIQNIWATWEHGPRARHRAEPATNAADYDMTREVGIMDVNLDALHLRNPFALFLQLTCLLAQISGSVSIAKLNGSLEPLIVILVGLTGQALLVFAIIPRKEVWERAVRGHRCTPIMLHRKLDSQGVLIVRRVQFNGRDISLEEYTWKAPTARNWTDILKILAAGFAFISLILQILLISWMQAESHATLAILGAIGLAVNTIEAFLGLEWSSSYHKAVTWNPLCAPNHSSAMGAVGVLVAGKFVAYDSAARLLYPDNKRFADSLTPLESTFDSILCQSCRKLIRTGDLDVSTHRGSLLVSQSMHQCQRILPSHAHSLLNDAPRSRAETQAVYHLTSTLDPHVEEISQTSQQNDSIRLRVLPIAGNSSDSTSAPFSTPKSCADLLFEAILLEEDKQQRDGLATVCHYLRHPRCVFIPQSNFKQIRRHITHWLYLWNFPGTKAREQERLIPKNDIDTSRRGFRFRPGRTAQWNDWSRWT